MKPVPSRCVEPTIEGLTLYHYMSDDQRCFTSRPDVLVFQTDTLREDVTFGGEITARLQVSTTGTDADYVVKLIDVYPPDTPDSPYQPDTTVHMAGYQQLVRGEIMRGRFRKSFATPEPFTPNQVDRRRRSGCRTCCTPSGRDTGSWCRCRAAGSRRSIATRRRTCRTSTRRRASDFIEGDAASVGQSRLGERDRGPGAAVVKVRPVYRCPAGYRYTV